MPNFKAPSVESPGGELQTAAGGEMSFASGNLDAARVRMRPSDWGSDVDGSPAAPIFNSESTTFFHVLNNFCILFCLRILILFTYPYAYRPKISG